MKVYVCESGREREPKAEYSVNSEGGEVWRSRHWIGVGLEGGVRTREV